MDFPSLRQLSSGIGTLSLKDCLGNVLMDDIQEDHSPNPDELRNNKYAEPQLYNKIYTQLIHECTTLEKEGEFSICFTDLHQNFLRYRTSKLWDLIRLVKHWYQLCKEKLREPLPSLYALELLTVYVWELSNKNQEKTTAKSFRTVLELVAYYKDLRIYWTWYYDFRHEEVSAYLQKQVKKARPLILDPADPTRNVAGSDLQAWDLLAKEAQIWMQSSCFRNCDMSFVPTWNLSPEKHECVFQ